MKSLIDLVNDHSRCCIQLGRIQVRDEIARDNHDDSMVVERRGQERAVIRSAVRIRRALVGKSK